MDHTTLCSNCFESTGAADPCPQCGYTSKAPASHVYLKPGTVLFGKYLVGRVLGQGGFGITYLGWDMNLDVKLAIKEFFPQGLVSREPGASYIVSFACTAAEEYNYGIERFLDEAKTLARFEDHPNIVSVRDFFRENKTAYMVMGFVKGITLEKHLENQGGKIPFDKAVEILMPVMDALRKVHEVGFLHRDISPDNLLIDKNGRVVLIDFGAARQAMGDKSRSMSVIMKAGYSPLEQYQSKGKQGPWTDIYAVAATMYHALTGVMPPESLDRLKEDPLALPSTIKVKIETHQEDALLMAMAIQAEERFQTVEEFQEILLGKKPVEEKKSPEAVKEKADKPGKPQDEHEETKKCPFCSEQIKATAIICKHCKMSLQEDLHEARKRPRKTHKAGHKTLNKQLTITSVVILGLVLAFYSGSWLLTEGEGDAEGPAVPEAEEASQTYDPAVIAGLDADYYIDYENGIIPIGDLPIGARVVDPSWEWEFRTGSNYTYKAGDETKPVIWIVVAKNHYEIDRAHVTILSEELIANYWFDDSTDRGSDYGSNHWGKMGSTNATTGLRPWLNSTGIHKGEGFYQAFSANFENVVVSTYLPNLEWKEGQSYKTKDKVFIPSSTELGDTDYECTYKVGSLYPYFANEENKDRKAGLGQEKDRWYWTRSPCLDEAYSLRGVSFGGEFFCYSPWASVPDYRGIAVRPALNLKSEILVSEINH